MQQCYMQCSVLRYTELAEVCLCVRLLGKHCPWIVPCPQPLWDVQPRGDEIKGRSGLIVVGSEPNLLAMLMLRTVVLQCIPLELVDRGR